MPYEVLEEVVTPLVIENFPTDLDTYDQTSPDY
jgi:hypothetical protein